MCITKLFGNIFVTLKVSDVTEKGALHEFRWAHLDVNSRCQKSIKNNSDLGTPGIPTGSVAHNEFCHFQWILANLQGNTFWAVEISSLGLSRNIQEHSEGKHKRLAEILWSHCCDPTRKIQERCVRCWGPMMGHHTGHYFLAVVHQATEKQNAANSLLSQHSGSLVAIRPGNSSYVSMTAQHYFCVLCYLTLRGRD